MSRLEGSGPAQRAPLPDWWWQQTLLTRRLIAAAVVLVAVVVLWTIVSGLFGDDDAEATAPPSTLLPAERIALWERVAECETGGEWDHAGTEFSGGLRISHVTWQGVGASGLPHQVSAEQQMLVAEDILAAQGWGAWPACARQLGLSG